MFISFIYEIQSEKPVSVQAIEFPERPDHPSAATAIAIGKKLLEIKRISGAGEMTELNMAL